MMCIVYICLFFDKLYIVMTIALFIVIDKDKMQKFVQFFRVIR